MIRGGAQQVVLDLLRGQQAAGLEVMLVAGGQSGLEGSLWQEVDALGIETERVPSLVREISPRRDVASLLALRRIIRRHRPQIVHTHTSKAGFVGTLAARFEKVPVVLLAPHGHIMGKDANIPGVPEKGLKRWILAMAARQNSRYTHGVIVPNEAEHSDGIRHGLWTRGNSVVIPNGIDTTRFRPGGRMAGRLLLDLPHDKFVIGVAARLTREKGVDRAVHLMGDLPGMFLVIAGDGPEADALKKLAVSRGASDRVRFAGMQPDMASLYPAFDVCLVPSRTEAHGLAAAEASACGIPVVASSVGGLRSVVVDGRTGFLVPQENPAGYRMAIMRLAADGALARSLGEAGRRHIKEHFSYRVMMHRVLALYRQRLQAQGLSV